MYREDPAGTARPKISLCVIAQDEEYNLPQCLGPLRGVVNEMVVADTGSGDRTREVAQSFGARVFAAQWSDNFAAVRNASIEHARGEWILSMGARDHIDAENLLRLKELIGQLNANNVAYTMRRVGVERLPGAGFIEIEQIRLFRNDPLHRWKYRVCEQILPSMRLNNCQVRRSAISIRHSGETDPVRRRHELERDLRLLHLDHADDPDDPMIQFNLARYFHGLQQPEQALQFLSGMILERFHNKKIWIGPYIYRLMVQCHRDLHQSEQALRVAAEGLAIYPRDTQLQLAKAMILLDGGDTVEGEEAFRRLLDASEDNRSFKEVRQCPGAGGAKQAETFGRGSPRRFRL